MKPRALSLSLLSAIAVLTAATAASAGGFVEERISFPTHDGLVLEGIVSYPKAGDGPFPAMVLIHGSGLHDADVTIDVPDWDFTRGEQRLFRGLARFFSRRGMVVLRYNKRGASFAHESDQPFLLLSSTLDDLVRDAESALRALASHPLADPGRLVLYGHSEGSMVAPRVALRAGGDVELVVLVGSVASAFEDILYFQGVEIFRLFLELAGDADGDGTVTLEELDRLDGDFGRGSFWVGSLAPVIYALERQPDDTFAVTGVNSTIDTDGDGRLHIADEIVPELRRLHRDTVGRWRSGEAAGSYGQSLMKATPTRKLIARVRTPILFCQGELDVQTPLAETLDLIGVLESNGRDYEALLFAKLGHSLSKPNDFFKDDGGLTLLDNPTLNAMKKQTMRKILKRVKELLRG